MAAASGPGRHVRPRILFRVAAGPRIGSGHMVRALRLAALTGLPALFSVRGARLARLQAEAGAVGTLVSGSAKDVMRCVRPALVVVDDPSLQAGARWVAAARRHACPVVAVVDCGIGATNADLVIDSSVARPMRPYVGHALLGPRYAVVDPAIARAGPRKARSHPSHVLISLGGGGRSRYARRLAELLVRAYPTLRVVVAGGFAGPPNARSASSRIQWIGPQPSLVPWLASASVAVVAGGITLYEACALGVPTVAVPIVDLQRGPVRAMKRLGAVSAPPIGRKTPARAHDVVPLVGALLRRSRFRTHLVRRATATVDGRGAFRVSRLLDAIAAATAASAVAHHKKGGDDVGGR